MEFANLTYFKSLWYDAVVVLSDIKIENDSVITNIAIQLVGTKCYWISVKTAPVEVPFETSWLLIK